MKYFATFLLLLLYITNCWASPTHNILSVNETDVDDVSYSGCPPVACPSCALCDVVTCACPVCECDAPERYVCPIFNCNSVDAEEDLKTTLKRVKSCNIGFWWINRYVQQDVSTFKQLKEITPSYNQSHMLQLWKSIKLDQKIKFEEYYKVENRMADPWELKPCDLDGLKIELKHVKALETKLNSQSTVLIKTLQDSELLLSACNKDKPSRRRRDLNNDDSIEDTANEFADTDYEFDCVTAMNIVKLESKNLKSEIEIEKFKHGMVETCISAVLESETFIKQEFSDYFNIYLDEKMSLLMLHYTNLLEGVIDGHSALSNWGNKMNFPCYKIQRNIEETNKKNMELFIRILIDNKKLQDILIQLKKCDKESPEEKLQLASELQLTTINGRKYYFQHDKKTKWKTANDFCLSHGMHLIIINNQDEHDFLQNEIQNQMRQPKTFRSYWTDGIQLAVGYPLAVWNSTRIPIKYSHIVPHSLQLTKRSFVYFGRTQNEDFLWGLSPCTTNRHFICEQY